MRGCDGPLAQHELLPQESEQSDSSEVTCLLGLKALWADHGSDEGHQVEEKTDPAGDHLEPIHRCATIHYLLDLMVIVMKPVGDSHHDVERSQEEDKMEVGVAVDGCLSLII